MKDSLSILHVYNQVQNHDHICALLEQAGYSANFIHTESIKDFEQVIQSVNLDLIICDTAHPTLPAQELLSVRNEHHTHIPFIVTGINNLNNEAERYFNTGANDVLQTSQLNLLPYIIKREIMRLEATNGQADIFHENQLLYSVFDLSLSELFLMDAESFRFTLANEAMVKNMGYTKEEFLTLSFDDTVAAHHREPVKNIIHPFLKGEKKVITFQKDSLRKNGSYYPVQIHLQYLNRGEQQIIAGECIDLSHRKRQAAMLQEQKQITRELRLSNKYKSDFFANLSHEMRTTLNTVLLLSQILTENRGDNLNKDQLNYTASIHNSTNSLLSLLNEVLDLSKIESGKMSINLEYVEIMEFCKELERLFQPVASEKGITFEFVNELKTEIPYKTDPLRLEQVLKNLISNALKFTKEGFVRLKVYQPDQKEIKSLSKTFDFPAVAFRVIDTGIGIPEDQQKQIFESYTQVNNENATPEFGGTGLGLAISKEIVKVMGGEIKLKSKQGAGSTITIYLPTDSSPAILRYAKQGKIKLSTTPSAAHTVEPKKKTKLSDSRKIEGTVLLVDDNLNHNMALQEYLGFKIQTCITAQSAKEAYEILNSQPVHCIILDMYLPDADGKEVLRKIKTDPNIQNTPVIIYSGKSLSQNEEEELEKLADAIIQKNVMSYKVLLSKITGILHKVNYSAEN